MFRKSNLTIDSEIIIKKIKGMRYSPSFFTNWEVYIDDNNMLALVEKTTKQMLFLGFNK